MEVDPMENIEQAEEQHERKKSHLNSMVAITIALLATFMGLCKVKSENINQAMQRAESERVNNYSWYQARNIREEVMTATAAQLEAMAAAMPKSSRPPLQAQAAVYRKLALDQKSKKEKQLADADLNEKRYDQPNLHDDQFDISDALLAIAIALLAMTSLTQKRALYFAALVPTLFGILMGLAGLMNWNWKLDFLSRLLSP